jgi:hypothetical protein
MTSFERAEQFKGVSAGIEAARLTLCSIALRRNFAESTEDFLARDKNAADLHAKASDYLRAKGAI